MNFGQKSPFHVEMFSVSSQFIRYPISGSIQNTDFRRSPRFLKDIEISSHALSLISQN